MDRAFLELCFATSPVFAMKAKSPKTVAAANDFGVSRPLRNTRRPTAQQPRHTSAVAEL
jgi:hypothetical protein